MKSKLSRIVKFLRESLKKIALVSASRAFRSRSFPLFGIPRGLTLGTAPNEGVQRLLYPALSIKMSPPKTIDDELFWCIRQILEGVHLPEEGILTLKDGLATGKGGNLSCKGSLVTTYLQPIDGKPPHQNELFYFSTKKFWPKIYDTTEPVATIAAGWQGAFYHWIYEVLPRLHLLEKAGHAETKIFVESACAFQDESLALLEIPKSRIINVSEYAAVRTPELIVPSIPLIPTEWSCRFLREKFLPKIEKKNKLRLYISRSDAERRRILNENEVMTLLQQYGFIKIALSRFSLKEQMELFHAAEAVIGPHGAGFSHLVFCQPYTPVLEIFSPAYFNPCYWHISDRIDLSYHYLFGEGQRCPENVQTRLDPPILVDCKKLYSSLELMSLIGN